MWSIRRRSSSSFSTMSLDSVIVNEPELAESALAMSSLSVAIFRYSRLRRQTPVGVRSMMNAPLARPAWRRVLDSRIVPARATPGLRPSARRADSLHIRAAVPNRLAIGLSPRGSAPPKRRHWLSCVDTIPSRYSCLIWRTATNILYRGDRFIVGGADLLKPIFALHHADESSQQAVASRRFSRDFRAAGDVADTACLSGTNNRRRSKFLPSPGRSSRWRKFRMVVVVGHRLAAEVDADERTHGQ